MAQNIYFTTDRGHNWELRNSPFVYVYDLFVLNGYILPGQQAFIHNVSHTADGENLQWTNYPCILAEVNSKQRAFFSLTRMKAGLLVQPAFLGGTNYGKITLLMVVLHGYCNSQVQLYLRLFWTGFLS